MHGQRQIAERPVWIYSGMRLKPIKRKTRRRRHHTAWVTLKDGITRLEIRVVDVSDDGAQIICTKADALPDRFTLALALTASTRRTYEIVWRRGRTLGIKSVDENALAMT